MCTVHKAWHQRLDYESMLNLVRQSLTIMTKVRISAMCQIEKVKTTFRLKIFLLPFLSENFDISEELLLQILASYDLSFLR